ncbi:hypothetical protein [Wenzhouxiangella limi]|uniref:YtxH domain-containing protein n=1 Tax=Wenzhouxiangella limi TaxID=2707351 RepID=A0A845UZ10_9GAMM|nr:hypothetical protein [Wenzhouxiangella limi]NDY94306.1 hypothetical protein [Wenzhouxiangella limi]
MYDQPPRGSGCNQEEGPDPAQQQAAGGPPPGYGWGYYGPPPGAPGTWGPYAAGPDAATMPGWGPMGPGYGPVYGPGPHGMAGHGPGGGYGPGAGYGPGGAPGMQGQGPGGGRGPGMEQIIEEMAAGSGLAGLGKLLDFEDTDFWKGALVGAAAVLLLTNETVQQSLFKSGVKARDVVEKGLDSLRPKAAEEETEPAAKPAPAKTRSTTTRTKKKESSS